MQNRLQISHISKYQSFDPVIEIEKKRTKSYYVTIHTMDETSKYFLSQLKLEYGPQSENFLKSNRITSFFDKGTGSGSNAINSYVRFHKISEDVTIIFFDFDIKAIIENEIQNFNEQNRVMHLTHQNKNKSCNLL